MEDICGLRIICYYPSDLEKVSPIIKSEYDVKESVDKADLMEPDRFGTKSK
jgi:putative GTP pyrophosphokinase